MCGGEVAGEWESSTGTAWLTDRKVLIQPRR